MPLRTLTLPDAAQLRSLLLLGLFFTACNLPPRPHVLSTFGSKVGVMGQVRSSPHKGVDFYAPLGANVLAVSDGMVIGKRFDSRIGWIVTVLHNEPGSSRYLHLRSTNVSLLEKVVRGQSLGQVGMFWYSGGRPHVHLELRDRSTGLVDATKRSRGCFDPTITYSSDSAPTFPIRCSESIWNEPSKDASSLAGATVSLEAASMVNSIGLGSRAVVNTGVPVADFHLFAGWRAAAGKSARGWRYEGRLLSGLGVSNRVYDFALLTGIGASSIADVAPRAIEVPFLSILRIKHGRASGFVWLRASRVLQAPSRKDGASISLFGADEFALGVSTKIPPTTRLGVVVSLEYQELLDRRMFTLGIGTSFDSLWSN